MSPRSRPSESSVSDTEEGVAPSKQFLFTAILGLFAVVLSLVIAEVALRTVYPRSERYYVLEPLQTATLTPAPEHVSGVSRTAVYTTSSVGIRGPEFADTDEYRILAIGGSTTQNAYLDQSRTWTNVLATRLNERPDAPRTWSGDIGRSGHTARSHRLQFEFVPPGLPPIDAVVMLVGVNDLTIALRQGFDYVAPPPLSDPETRTAQMREAFLRVPGRLHDRTTMYQQERVAAFKRLAVYQLVRQARDRFVQMRGGTSQDQFGATTTTWRNNRAAAGSLIDSLPDLGSQLDVYRAELEGITAIAAERGTRLVFMTQPTLWRDDLSPQETALLWLGGLGDFQSEPGHDYFTPGALDRAMDAYNRTMLEVCAASVAECFDLAAELPADTTMFFDDVHFTERGSVRVAELLAQYLDARPPYGSEGG